MWKAYRNIIKVFLPVLFVLYLGDITLFTHSHVVNGVVIVHSHPFKGKHHHTEAQLETIFFLSTFHSPSLPHCPIVASGVLILLWVLLVPLCGHIDFAQHRCGIYLRAPPLAS